MNKKFAEKICSEVIKMMMGKICRLIEKNETSDWAEYSIETYNGNFSFNVNMDFQSIEFLIKYGKDIYVVLNEEAHYDMIIRIASFENIDDVPGRSFQDISEDIETLLKVFTGGDFHHFMYVANNFSTIENPRMDYFGSNDWHNMYNCYTEMKS